MSADRWRAGRLAPRISGAPRAWAAGTAGSGLQAAGGGGGCGITQYTSNATKHVRPWSGAVGAANRAHSAGWHQREAMQHETQAVHSKQRPKELPRRPAPPLTLSTPLSFHPPLLRAMTSSMSATNPLASTSPLVLCAAAVAAAAAGTEEAVLAAVRELSGAEEAAESCTGGWRQIA